MTQCIIFENIIGERRESIFTFFVLVSQTLRTNSPATHAISVVVVGTVLRRAAHFSCAFAHRVVRVRVGDGGGLS
jgi:hypothetical protein